MMLHFGYYLTESSEHAAESMPHWIKRHHPEIIEQQNLPLDEDPRWCVHQIDEWKKPSHELTRNPHLTPERTHEYGPYIIEAIETAQPLPSSVALMPVRGASKPRIRMLHAGICALHEPSRLTAPGIVAS